MRTKQERNPTVIPNTWFAETSDHPFSHYMFYMPVDDIHIDGIEPDTFYLILPDEQGRPKNGVKQTREQAGVWFRTYRRFGNAKIIETLGFNPWAVEA